MALFDWLVSQPITAVVLALDIALGFDGVVGVKITALPPRTSTCLSDTHPQKNIRQEVERGKQTEQSTVKQVSVSHAENYQRSIVISFRRFVDAGNKHFTNTEVEQRHKAVI